jgi:hypothetical protein
VACSLAATPATSETHEGSQDTLAHVADSAQLSTPVVAEGRVSRSRGNAAGATVYLAAWPNGDQLEAMGLGDPLRLVPVAKATVARDGSYALRMDPGIDVSHLWSEAGTLDVEVAALDAEGFATYSFSLVPADGVAGNDAATIATAQVDPRTRRVTGAAMVDLTLGERGRLGAGQPKGRQDVASDETPTVTEYDPAGVEEAEPTFGIATSQGSCPGGAGQKATYRNQQVNVGEVHIQTTGKRMKFDYTGSASSTLGVGISSSGAYGSYSASGTVVRNRSMSTGFPEYTSSTTRRYLDTFFTYGKFCVNVSGGGYNYHKYEVRSTAHEGGTAGRDMSNAISATYCVPYREAGSTGSKTTTAAKTWSNGAKVGGVIGIDLSTRTGYATDAKISFTFTSPGRLCGTDAMPNETPRRLVMRAP